MENGLGVPLSRISVPVGVPAASLLSQLPANVSAGARENGPCACGPATQKKVSGS